MVEGRSGRSGASCRLSVVHLNDRSVRHRTGTASRDVVTLDVLGADWDSEVDLLKWGTFIAATGRSGWKSVTLTITCHR